MTVTIPEFAKHLLAQSVHYYWANKTVHCRVLPDGRVRYWANWEGDISREFASLETLLNNSPAYLPDAEDLAEHEKEARPEPSHHVISDAQFQERFAPVKNHLNTNAPFDGCMFETFGEEVEHVRAQDPALVWTIIDCDGTMAIESGCHFVNRLGYLVASRPRPDMGTYSVIDDTAEPQCDAVTVSRSRLRVILDYLHDSEADHYDETCPEDVNNHVYAHALAIEAQLTEAPRDRSPVPPDVLCELAHALTVRECGIRGLPVDAQAPADDDETRYADDAQNIFDAAHGIVSEVLGPYCEKDGAR